jgi:hypothetical protein
VPQAFASWSPLAPSPGRFIRASPVSPNLSPRPQPGRSLVG